MSLTATARSILGTLRQEVVIDGQHRLITDQPERLGGGGSGPAPHGGVPARPRGRAGEGGAPSPRERFPAALAACVTVTLVQYGRTKGWELGDVRVAVDYDHYSTPRQIDIALELDGDLTDAQLERLARVARACPLRRSVEVGMEF